jgi:hypothetical protein
LAAAGLLPSIAATRLLSAAAGSRLAATAAIPLALFIHIVGAPTLLRVLAAAALLGHVAIAIAFHSAARTGSL